MIRVGIVGATGYTGVELLRLLATHDGVEVAVATSRASEGRRADHAFPNLRGHCEIEFVAPDDAALRQCDVVFLATPNGTAMHQVPPLLDAGVRVIDVSADFRLADAAEWSRWYGMEHACPELLSEAVYGLPELNRESIRGARLVANPGCYATAVQLGFLPLVEAGCVDAGRLVADGKSGTSGAGRRERVDLLLAEASDSVRAYGAGGHRHHAEIVQGLVRAGGRDVGLTFVPHLVPMIRGIHATLYAELDASAPDVQELFERRYAGEAFVDVLPAGSHPETRSVRGANQCRIAVHDAGGGRIVVLAVIDNLVKGAAGQAIQNMNLVCGMDETLGLNQVAVLP